MSRRRVLCVVLALTLTACTGAAQQQSSDGPSAAPTEVMTITAGTSSEPVSPQEQIVAAYREYTEVVGDVLARGVIDHRAREVASGQALRDLRARVRANRRQGVRTSGRLEPSVRADDVAWDGVGAAEVSDCVLNGLAHVEAADSDQVATEATGTRRPVEALLEQVDGTWVVTKVEMPQDDGTLNPQTDPPFLRGPMPDGPPSCAPPAIEREILAGYRAFWDAFDRAFGFGRDGPANPNDPALAATSVDPQLSSSKDFLTSHRERDRAARGVRDLHDAWLVALTDHDTSAVVADCVTLQANEVYSIDENSAVATSTEGQLNLYETRLSNLEQRWKVADWNVRGEGVQQCQSP